VPRAGTKPVLLARLKGEAPPAQPKRRARAPRLPLFEVNDDDDSDDDEEGGGARGGGGGGSASDDDDFEAAPSARRCVCVRRMQLCLAAHTACRHVCVVCAQASARRRCAHGWPRGQARKQRQQRQQQQQRRQQR
jgi:hypothetical protein